MTRTVIADRVDDQRTLLRLALARDPGFDVVAETSDGREAIALVQRCEADLLLFDIDLAGLDGIAVLTAVHDLRPECVCVLVTSLPPSELGAARELGAVGFMARSTPATQLAGEIRAVAAVAAAVGVGTASARLHVGSDKLAPRTARRFVNDVLAERGFDEVLDTVELLVTEVVTNAVVHARSEADVVVRLLPGAVRVEVCDGDDSFPVRRNPGPDQPGGRGFELVELMSRSWGIDMLDVGKRVWFEVAAS